MSYLAVAAAAILSSGFARASVVTSLPGGTVYNPAPMEYFGKGPETFGPGITWTSTDGSSVFAYDAPYGFGSNAGNGYWRGLVMEGTDNYAATSIMTFTFSSPVSSVGGFLNYSPGFADPFTIAVYDGATLLESYDPTINTGGADNAGAFYGFSEGSADITSFTLAGSYGGITDLTLGGAGSATPEPGSFVLLGTGLVGLVSRKLRRK
jgi:hypothetical protein